MHYNYLTISLGETLPQVENFSAEPSYSENCFQLIFGHGFPLTQHAFLLTKHAFPLMYIFFADEYRPHCHRLNS